MHTSSKNTALCSNPYASAECQTLMRYLLSIQGKHILAGQQTSYLPARELDTIRQITGKLPALRGFDLMSYSLATQTPEQTSHCREELSSNPGSVDAAIRWAKESRGLVTFCWHWFSPLYGKNKSFYTEDTQFDISRAVIPGTAEYHALLRDIDAIAIQLGKLANERIPVLWRPLHEASGGWFWWGAKDSVSYCQLYILLYERLTCYHGLSNLIWVWNSPSKGWYPGDDYVDILSTDIYAPPHDYGSLKEEYLSTQAFSPSKPVALGENGPIPDPALLHASQTPWLWFLTWGGEFVFTEKHSAFDHLKQVYHNPYTITLEDLPDLF